MPTLPIRTFLVKKLKKSNNESLLLISSGKVLINGSAASITDYVTDFSEVAVEGEIIQVAKDPLYLAYFKPRGVECTLSQTIKDNLYSALGLSERVYPIGRLDKDSEGLLLLTNHGVLYNYISHSKYLQEKEYLVKVDHPITDDFLHRMGNGMVIMGQKTRPCRMEKTDSTTFKIILTQGLNRQIRRMCFKLGYVVITLIRTRISNIHLGNMQPGDWRHLEEQEVKELTMNIP